MTDKDRSKSVQITNFNVAVWCDFHIFRKGCFV